MIELNIEDSCLPAESIVDFDGLEGIVPVGKQDRTEALAPVVGSQGDVGAEDGAGLPEKILEVLPSDAEGEVVDE